MFYGIKLKEIRGVHGMTQEVLAKKLCISEKDIFMFEKGMKEPDFNTLVKMAQLFKVKTMFFYKESFLKSSADISSLSIF